MNFQPSRVSAVVLPGAPIRLFQRLMLLSLLLTCWQYNQLYGQCDQISFTGTSSEQNPTQLTTNTNRKNTGKNSALKI